MEELLRKHGEQNYERVHSMMEWVGAMVRGAKGYQQGNFSNTYSYEDGKFYRHTQYDEVEEIEANIYDTFRFLDSTGYLMYVVYPDPILVGGE